MVPEAVLSLRGCSMHSISWELLRNADPAQPRAADSESAF